MGGICENRKSKMAAVSHIENVLFNGLEYSALQYLIFRGFGVKESIFHVNFIIWPSFDLQIQDGCQYTGWNGQFYKFIIKNSDAATYNICKLV